MYARAVKEAAARLSALRREECADLVLAALTLGLAVVATQVRPGLAVSLFLGGLTVGALGLRASWRRWDPVERLAGEGDAYVISEVSATRRGWPRWTGGTLRGLDPGRVQGLPACALT